MVFGAWTTPISHTRWPHGTCWEHWSGDNSDSKLVWCMCVYSRVGSAVCVPVKDPSPIQIHTFLLCTSGSQISASGTGLQLYTGGASLAPILSFSSWTPTSRTRAETGKCLYAACWDLIGLFLIIYACSLGAWKMVPQIWGGAHSGGLSPARVHHAVADGHPFQGSLIDTAAAWQKFWSR